MKKTQKKPKLPRVPLPAQRSQAFKSKKTVLPRKAKYKERPEVESPWRGLGGEGGW